VLRPTIYHGFWPTSTRRPTPPAPPATPSPAADKREHQANARDVETRRQQRAER